MKCEICGDEIVAGDEISTRAVADGYDQDGSLMVTRHPVHAACSIYEITVVGLRAEALASLGVPLDKIIDSIRGRGDGGVR